MKTILLLAALSLNGGQLYQGPNEIKIWAFPRVQVCSKACYEAVSVIIQRHKDNRWRSLVWNSEEGESGLSLDEMEGEDSAYEFVSLIRISPGFYLFEACVYRAKERFCARQEVIVK